MKKDELQTTVTRSWYFLHYIKESQFYCDIVKSFKNLNFSINFVCFFHCKNKLFITINSDISRKYICLFFYILQKIHI